MTRDEAIQMIEESFPPDARDPWRASEGRRLLTIASEQTAQWRDAPTATLQRMATMCRDRIERARRDSERSRYTT